MSDVPNLEPPDLDDHISKREVIEAFNHLGSEWNEALRVMHERLDAMDERLKSIEPRTD